MLKPLIYSLIILVISSFLWSCQSVDLYYVEMDNSYGIKKNSKIEYLGVEIGYVQNVSILKTSDGDRAFLTLAISEQNILYPNSFLKAEEPEKVILINTSSFSDQSLKPGDTLKHFLNIEMILHDLTDQNKIKITPIENSTIEELKSFEVITSVDQQKKDSLTEKIEKLNHLINEINGNH